MGQYLKYHPIISQTVSPYKMWKGRLSIIINLRKLTSFLYFIYSILVSSDFTLVSNTFYTLPFTFFTFFIYLFTVDTKVIRKKGRCPWCNGYRHRKWTRRREFKSWPRLIAFHIALIPLGKVWIQLFSLQLWVNSRADWVLQPWWGN